ncbi:MAG: response regulator [Anaerolineae bacterium]|nr:response regulator [Anaerolineae bacterium]
MDPFRLLIVDDDEAVRQALVQTLQGEDCQVTAVATGQEALKQTADARADIVIADIKMPGMGGLELLRLLRARGDDAMVVALAESADAGRRAVQEGAFDYLLKPLAEAAEIRHTIRRALERYELEKRQAAWRAAQHERAVVSTGNAEIDAKMGGGIPLGSLTLIDGHSHAGKSVLTQQMVWGSLREGYRLSYFTTENTVKSLVRQMQSLNIDVLDYILLRRLRVIPMEVASSRRSNLTTLLAAIRSERARGSDIVVVDALTPFVLSTQAPEVVSFFEGCKRLCSEGATTLCVMHSHAVSGELLVRLTSLCDAHLSLRTEEAGNRLIKVMEVAKVRGASRNTGNIVSFEIEPGLGMRIIPISKAQG